MSLPIVDELRVDKWVMTRPSDRLVALQSYEYQLAAQEGRNPCAVELIPPEELAREAYPDNFYGQHIREHFDENGKLVPETIQINPRLIENDSPYPAVDTYFHEARHSYQDYIADNPEFAENKQFAQDCYKAKHGGYLTGQESYAEYHDYRCQPVEIDANHAGQTRGAILYEQFGESDGHMDYMNSPEYATQNEWFANEKMYADEARALVDRKYELMQIESRTQDTQELQSEEVNEQSNMTVETDQDYDYFQGYGY